MPRVLRKAKRRSAGYDQHHVSHLLRGIYLHPGSGFATAPKNSAGDCTDVEAMRIAWDILKADLLPAFVAENPGHRPYAWWCFDAPERRQRTDGVQHPFDNRIRRKRIAELRPENPAFEQYANELFWGKPRCLFVADDFDAKYETELDYLRRLNLLLPEEAAALDGKGGDDAKG